MAQKPKPWIEIVENIASNSYRFRYESENRPHGNIFGFNSTPKKPTYPKIRIHGIEAKGHIIVCCVSEKKPYMVHPHKVFSKAGGINSHGAYVVPIVKGQKEIEFKSLTIQCVKRKNMASSLEMRQKVRIDPYRSGFDHIANPSSIDPFALRLCFQGFFIKRGTTKHSIITDPVVSQPIYDRNSTSDLTISKLNMAWAPVTGGSQLIFECPNVSENDIKVRFFKMEEDKVVWECVCDAAEVYDHVLVKVITPPYPDLKVINAVTVEIQLMKPSTGESGRPVPFSLLPGTWKTEEMGIGDPEVTIKRKRKRYLRIELSEIPKKAPCGCLLLPMINPICPIHNTQTDLDAPQTNRMKRPKVFFFNEKLGQERTANSAGQEQAAAYSVNGAASVPQVKLLKQKVQSAIRDLIAEKTTELQSASEPLNNQVHNNSPTPRNIPRKHNPTTAPPQNRKYKNLIPQPNPPKKQTYGEQISVIGVPNYQAHNNGAAGKQNMSTGQAYPQIPSAPALPINSPVCHTNNPVIHQDYQYGYNNINNQARVMNNQPQQQQYQYDYSGSSQQMQNNQGLLNNYNFQNNQVIQNHQNVQNHQNILINYQNLDNPNVQHDRGVQGKHNMPNGYNIPINQNIPSYQHAQYNHNSLNNHNMHNTYTITNGHNPPNDHMNLNNYNPQNNQNYQNQNIQSNPNVLIHQNMPTSPNLLDNQNHQNTQTNPNVVIHHNMPSNPNVLNNQNLQNNHSFQNNLVPYQQQYNHTDNYDYGSRPHIKPIILYPDSSPPSCSIEYTPPVNWPYPISIPGQYQDMYAIQANSPQNIAACAQSPMTGSINHLNNDQGQQMVQALPQCMNIPALEAAPADHDKIMDVTFAPDFDWEKYIQSLSDSLSDIKIL